MNIQQSEGLKNTESVTCTISRVSGGHKEVKTFNSLKELTEWHKELEETIILERIDGKLSIIIYDDYIE